MITEFVLCSGSLKSLAESYDVSYPTIRARLDRVIKRLRAVVEQRAPDPLTELIALYIARGEVSPGAARAIRDLHRSLYHPLSDGGEDDR